LGFSIQRESGNDHRESFSGLSERPARSIEKASVCGEKEAPCSTNGSVRLEKVKVWIQRSTDWCESPSRGFAKGRGRLERLKVCREGPMACVESVPGRVESGSVWGEGLKVGIERRLARFDELVGRVCAMSKGLERLFRARKGRSSRPGSAEHRGQ
jgi:hypothetical protein